MCLNLSGRKDSVFSGLTQGPTKIFSIGLSYETDEFSVYMPVSSWQRYAVSHDRDFISNALHLHSISELKSFFTHILSRSCRDLIFIRVINYHTDKD